MKKNFRELFKHERYLAGEVFEIGTIIPPINLISSITGEIIGKPIVYFAFDLASTLIGGVHIEAGSKNWKGVASTLVNCLDSKVEFCKRNGLSITAEEWPTTMLPRAIRVQYGNFYGKPINDMFEILNIEIQVVPNTMANVQKLKLSAILDRIIDFKVLKQDEIGGKQDASMILQDFTFNVLRGVVQYNNEIINGNKTIIDIIKNDVERTPSKVWNWYITNLGCGSRNISIETAKRVLLSRAKATVIESGIDFHNIKYVAETESAKKWHSDAIGTGIKYTSIRYDSRDISTIYLNNHGEIIAFLRKDNILNPDGMCFEKYV